MLRTNISGEYERDIDFCKYSVSTVGSGCHLQKLCPIIGELLVLAGSPRSQGVATTIYYNAV